VIEDDELELHPSPPGDSDPLDRVLIQRTDDLFPAASLDRRREQSELTESAPLFPHDEAETAPAEPPLERLAPLGARAKAFGVDALLCGIVASAAFLGAAAVVQRAPSATSCIWCAAFSVELSFFLCVPSLVLFVRTPGMALSDLTVENAAGEKPPLSFAFRRWIAGVLTALLGGLPLLTMAFDRRRRTPADLSSGWPLRPSPESLI